jgi:Xaa-Pro aminopeptidase
MHRPDESRRLLDDDDLEEQRNQISPVERQSEDLLQFENDDLSTSRVRLSDLEDPLHPDEVTHFGRSDDLDSSERPQHSFKARLIVCITLLGCFAFGAALAYYMGYAAVSRNKGRAQDSHVSNFSQTDLAAIQKCAIDNVHLDLSFLDNAPPIQPEEFIARRDRLAQALHHDGIDAFVLEPGYAFQYYGNVSQQDWEPWEPEERPFLMVIQPHVFKDGSVRAKTTYLAPHFEEDRVRMLGIPANEKLDIVVWEEHWNPYETLLNTTFAHSKSSNGPLISTEEELRDFIVRGLSDAGFRTTGLTATIAAVREQKSRNEIALLRAVNTGTVAAISAIQPCLVPGLSEDQVIHLLDNALLSIPGFSLFFNIVLFDSNAALPHGGKATGNATLNHTTVILIDVGAHYRGYSSDVARSFLIPFYPNLLLSPSQKADLTFKHQVFATVLAAQDASIKQFRPGRSAADVDIAARTVIAAQGWEKQFTHRVGHGIGIKAHESPYLHKGNKETELRANMTFTSEPGVYMTGKFGVRTEDIFVVTEPGSEVECLSGRRAKSLWEP